MKASIIDIRGNRRVVLGKFLVILYILNVTDLLFTKFLLSSAPSMFMEINMFLNPIIDGVAPYFMKIGGMAVVLLYWYWRSKESNIRQIRRSILVVKIIIGFYGLINIMHLINLVIYFVYKI